MKIRDLIAIAERNMRDTVRGERYRFGQALSNALYDEDAQAYNRLMADADLDQIDPYYNDDNLTRFIGWLIADGWDY